jgi:hypothetical protein
VDVLLTNLSENPISFFTSLIDNDLRAIKNNKFKRSIRVVIIKRCIYFVIYLIAVVVESLSVGK